MAVATTRFQPCSSTSHLVLIQSLAASHCWEESSFTSRKIQSGWLQFSSSRTNTDWFRSKSKPIRAARKVKVNAAAAGADCSSRREARAPALDSQGVPVQTRRLLCLSNGHGEDAIAVAILKALKELAEEEDQPLSIEALPLVGLGGAYVRAGIRTIGPAQMMPSGGFLYMDRKQIVGDLQAGLMALTWEQLTTLVKWTQAESTERATSALLAVGDVLPLAMAWVASKYEKTRREKDKGGRLVPYAFVGTAKSEFYVKELDGRKLVPEKRDAVEKLLSPACVHLPWERALMSADECAFTAPRDALTGEVLRTLLPDGVKRRVLDLGNPMMDDLAPTGALDGVLAGYEGFRRVAIMPGSRPPEVHRNFDTLLSAADSVAQSSPHERFLFLAPVVPSLEVRPFTDALARNGWQRAEEPLELPEISGACESPTEPLVDASDESLERGNGGPLQGGWSEDGTSENGVRTSVRFESASTLKESEQKNGNKVSARLREQAEHAQSSTQPSDGPSSTSQRPDAVECRDPKPTGSVSGPSLTRTQNEHLDDVVPEPFAADGGGWPEPSEGPVSSILFRKRGGDSAVLLVRGAFADCAQRAEAGLAMAGTATEQMVGLGKPVFTMPGGGPQFTFAFAEAQSRLLGHSVILCKSPSEVGPCFREIFFDERRLAEIREDGRQRMGQAGASKRIARAIWDRLLVENCTPELSEIMTRRH
ncbi:hypothetical protein KFL_001520180 [Klebsormidium nitens]|uniref:Lipid-A-disaccharide synthase n=1 Tax=Klebsormidium nitens TaxID=105231 RepID=A0A1Y1I614_KLENI|nr:hypothetical protein KFL_001520180 [Klebsormidium nitens]|eukprot:GAQ83548.1 hypothetical protein KFL_001520180 [Klebsormidium nitens]